MKINDSYHLACEIIDGIFEFSIENLLHLIYRWRFSFVMRIIKVCWNNYKFWISFRRVKCIWIRNAYSPVISLTWYTCVKADFYMHMDSFLCSLTDLTYKMQGLTVIYVPREGDELVADEMSPDKEMIKRMEVVVAYWTTQVRIALSDQEQATPLELLCLKDEYDFWIYRR